MHNVGDVLWTEWLGTFVGPRGLGIVTLEAHQGKFALRQARLDVGHPHPRTQQIGAQVEGKLFHERLRGTVNVTAWIRVGAGHRTNVDDVAAITGHHARQHRPGAIDQTLDVGVHHPLPILHVAAVGGF